MLLRILTYFHLPPFLVTINDNFLSELFMMTMSEEISDCFLPLRFTVTYQSRDFLRLSLPTPYQSLQEAFP